MTLYEVLDVSADCAAAEIENAYWSRRSASGHAGLLGRAIESLQMTADVDYAYFVLSDAQRRQDYDRSPDDFLEFHLVSIVI
ncbi:hypothetical protein JJB09_16930 [Rhizobium sp. KVB221]|uniref:J domain-containing protein n=1 Tax=Rhizobium setariae TaxID=2801340 RepID=A0A936YNH1_9HYPH|nr:hypothetical protein [Rhizobium setariae]MBL0373708.1 hypothetical protein [Rhizobium setariae]